MAPGDDLRRRRDHGLRDITCTILAARALGALGGGDPGTVTLISHSLGGWAGAVIAMTPDGLGPDAAQCRFAEGDPGPDAFAGLAGAYAIGDADGWEAIIGVARADDPDAWAALDPVALVGRYGAPAIPLLLLHGEDDRNVLPDVSRQLAAALTAAGLSTSVVIEAGVDHGAIPTAPETIRALVDLLTPD